MKKFLKLFLIGFLLINVLNNTAKVSADDDENKELGSTEIERSDIKISSYCPSANNPNLVSYCGRVTQALGTPVVLSDGSTASSVSQVPVKGVSVYLYECDNSSRTCKRDGLLSHPFSSTSTNKDGVFHLVGRKLESNWTYEYDNQYTNNIDNIDEDVTITNQSKKRYLVFKCGNYFQGIHIIPSYLDLTEIIHEVNCPKEFLVMDSEEFSYVPPLLQFDFIGGVKLAAQMGVDDPNGYYPEQRAEAFEAAGDNYDPNITYDGLENTIQAHYEEYANKKNSSVQVILKGADPRFTTPQHDAGKEEAIRNSSLFKYTGDLNNRLPALGAWYSKDCKVKYRDTDWYSYCNLSEEDLYTDSNISTMHLLPSLPPKQSLLYYRPLEIRNEISAYYQDHDDIAKYLGTMFSNCVGEVYKRAWETTPEDSDKPAYPNCEWLKQCNSAINQDSDVNSQTANGPAQGLMSPGSLDNLDYQMDPEIPVCLIAGEEEPVRIKQIQRPGQLVCKEYNPATKEGMRLCDGGAYWNNYYLTNLGNNNTALKGGYAAENKEDSYYRKEINGQVLDDGSDINSLAFQKKMEGKGEPRIGGQGYIQGSGDVSGDNSGGALLEIASGTEVSSTENLVNFLGAPFKDDEIKKEISDGLPYYISTRPVALGQFSKTNEYPEKIITNAEQDKDYLDPYAFGQEMECEACGDEHYPEDLANTGVPDIKGGKEGSGSRTPFEGITITTASKIRTQELPMNWKDNLDSAISISTGHSFIDWNMAKVKGKPTLIQAMSTLWDSIISAILGNRMGNKTFADRSPDNLGEFNNNFKINDELVAYGFKVNAKNFESLFYCPKNILPGSWGSDENTGCYPWHPVESCQTAATCNGTSGADSDRCENDPDADGCLSRTCKVDKCEKGQLEIKYECDTNQEIKIIDIIDTKDGSCSDIYLEDCAYNRHSSGIKRDTSPPACVGTGKDIIIRPYDYCTVAEAGPNECDGNILFDAEVDVYSQTIDDTENLNSPRSFNADTVAESGLEFQKAFRTPFSTDITPLPAAWVSVSSSLSETEPDVSLRKDFPGIGSGASFLTRAQFGQPHPISQFTELEPLYIHCGNKDIVDVTGGVGTTGVWDDGKTCDFATLPDPEVIKIEDLQNELDKIENPPCMLPENTSACERLILKGADSTGQPLKFSDTFKLVLNLAGNKFGLEPAAILVYMHKTGADKEYSYLWSEEGEEDLQKMTLPWYGAFPFCDDLEPVKQPPYDWKLSWFSEMFNTKVPGRDSPKGELTKLFKRQETASRCNFIDSTFTLAASIARNVKNTTGSQISCPDQKWDGYMKSSMKIQYHQLQVRPEDELKGSLKTEDVFPSNEGYEEIWNACK
ncbi:MAG TPA: hypothetical protein PKL88_01145 [bacterium]|nr:hypothetical protein [bacterium]